MAKIRKCTVCGHVEGEFVYFCTECGAKTEETNDGIGMVEPIAVEENDQPQNIAEYNSENVNGEENFSSSTDTKETNSSGSKTLQNMNVKQLYAIGGGVIAILLVIIIVLALPKSKKNVETEIAVNDQTVKEEILVDESESLEEVIATENVQQESETSMVILFDDSVGLNCSDEKTLENNIASFEYTLSASSMANTEPFIPTDNSILIVTESLLYDGNLEHTNDSESFYVRLYEYSYGNLNQVGGYQGNCDKIEGGIEFGVEPSKQYVLEIAADSYANGEMLKGHGHVYGVKSVGEDDISAAEATEELFVEPTKMHYYEEMYYDQTYILDYTLEFEHDDLGRITTVTNYDSNRNIENIVTQEYDADGNCTREYGLGANIEGLYLSSTSNVWNNGGIIQTSDGMYKQIYENDNLGKHISCDFYENNNNYMHQDYSYDSQGRVSNIYRVNYGGNWTVNMVYYYDGDSEKPYLMEWIYGDGTYGGDYDYDEYSYFYDEDRLIKEIDRYYHNGELSSITTKEYEY